MTMGRHDGCSCPPNAFARDLSTLTLEGRRHEPLPLKPPDFTVESAQPTAAAHVEGLPSHEGIGLATSDGIRKREEGNFGFKLPCIGEITALISRV